MVAQSQPRSAQSELARFGGAIENGGTLTVEHYRRSVLLWPSLRPSTSSCSGK
jgi:hypothetical protein